MKKLFMLMALIATSASAHDNECLQGVRAAYEAFTLVVYDPQEPNFDAIIRALKWRLKMQPFPASKEHAVNAMGYLLARVGEDGQILDLAIDEYVKRECVKYGR